MNACDFGVILKQLRKNRGMTQSEVGKHVGLSKAVVSKYENGLGYPSFDVLIRIADFFGVTTDFLLGVSRRKTIDVSHLTESQIESLQRIILEFMHVNAQ